MKKIFNVGTVSLVLTIVAIIIGYNVLMSNIGGVMAVSVPNGPGIAHVENFSATSVDNVLPLVSNPSKYPLKEFYLRYTFYGPVKIETGDLYTVTTQGDKTMATYNLDKLPGGQTATEPLAQLLLPDGTDSLRVEVDASFDGGTEAYQASLVCLRSGADQVTVRPAEPSVFIHNETKAWKWWVVVALVIGAFMVLGFLVSSFASVFGGITSAFGKEGKFWTNVRAHSDQAVDSMTSKLRLKADGGFNRKIRKTYWVTGLILLAVAALLIIYAIYLLINLCIK